MFDATSTNELGNAYLWVDMSAPQNLPAPLYSPAAGDNAGKACRPEHAYITVEGGDVRYRLDGTDVVEPFGILALDGSAIDWTNPLYLYGSFLDRMSVIATRINDGESQVLLNISWRT